MAETALGHLGPKSGVCLAIVALLSAVILSRWLGDNPIGLEHHTARLINWDWRRDEVKRAFVVSWDAYSQHAWGKDTYHPVAKTGFQMGPEGLGWIIVDSLDTMMLMNLTEPLDESLKWLRRNLSYDQDQNVSTFETTIRMLGGLLSAHHLSTRLPHLASHRDSIYLTQAVDLADRLLAAYESPTGIPYSSVNIGRRLGIPSQSYWGVSSLAEAGSVQLEMKYLSYLTGNDIYWRRAERAMQALDDVAMKSGLLPIFVNPDSGQFVTTEIRLGSRGDSYYEYLIKQYLQTSGTEDVYLDMWEEALAGIQKHMIATTKLSALKFVAELPKGIGGGMSPKMDHLVCFLPGTIALGVTGGHSLAEARRRPGWTSESEQKMDLARELTKTCWGMYRVTKTGLAPEIAWFNMTEGEAGHGPVKDSLSGWKADYIIKANDAHNLQRPETVESLFLMWRITQDALYREWGWQIFRAFERYTFIGTDGGYTSLHNVNEVPPAARDNMESYWLAETLKYLYLLFSPVDFIPLHDIVFNTEAHIFPRLTQSKWATGWTRRDRDPRPAPASSPNAGA